MERVRVPVVKVNISFEAMEKLTVKARDRGYTRAEKWDGIGRVRGMGKYVEWLSKQELMDDRPAYMKRDDVEMLKIGRVIDWPHMFRWTRIYRLSVVVERETLDRFVEKGMSLGMVPRSVSGKAYMGMVLEGVGEGLIKVVEKQ